VEETSIGNKHAETMKLERPDLKQKGENPVSARPDMKAGLALNRNFRLEHPLRAKA
jgi:hypothetical protein